MGKQVSIKRGFLMLAAAFFFVLAVSGRADAGFVRQNGQKYYFNSEGRKVTGWLKKGKKYYYLDPENDGAAATGLLKVGKKSYFFRKSGARCQSAFVKEASTGNTYYASKKGVLLSGLRKIKKRYYYFDKKTLAMKTGWVKTSSATYYMRGTGKLRGSAVTGWLIRGRKRYYFSKKGKMAKGLTVIGGKRYYFNASTGVQMTGRVMVNGKPCYFTRSGVPVNPKGPWKIKVNQSTCTVTVYRGSTPVRAFACSVGLNGATPDGTYSIKDHLRWHELMGLSWGQWCAHITGSILFHSIPYNAPYDKWSMSTRGYNLLGQAASHGCVRLAASSAKYIYDNVPIGTPVVIFHGSKRDDPLGKPLTPYIGSWTHTYDPTDPTINK